MNITRARMSRVITSDPGGGSTSTTAGPAASVIIDDVTPSATRVFSSLHLTDGTADLTLRDLTVQGTSTIINSSTVEMNDPVIDLNRGGTAAPLGGLRIINPSGAAPNKMIVYDTAGDGLRAGTEGSTRALAYRTETPANLRALTWSSAAKELVSMPDTFTTVYVAKNGNDANDGRSPQTAKLTVGAALALASTGWRVDVGPGTYTEAFAVTCPNGVHVDAECSDFNGQVILGPGCRWTWGSHLCPSTLAIQHNGGSASYVDLRHLNMAGGGASGLRVTTGAIYARIDLITIVSGTIIDETSSDAITLSFGRIVGFGAVTLTRSTNACQISMEGGQISLPTTGSAAFTTVGGAAGANFYLQCASLTVPTLTNISAATVCTIACLELLGAAAETGAGRAKLMSPTLLKAPAYEVAAPTLVSNTTDAVSFSTGALRTLGGLGVTKNLHVGLSARVEADLSTGGVAIIGGSLDSLGAFTAQTTCDVVGAVPSTSTGTGAIRVPNGGIGTTGAIHAGSFITAGNATAATPTLPGHLTTKAYVDGLVAITAPATWAPLLTAGVNTGVLGAASYTRFTRAGNIVTGHLSVPVTTVGTGPTAFGFALPVALTAVYSVTIRTTIGDASTTPTLYAASVAINPNSATSATVTWNEAVAATTTRVDVGFSYCL